METFPETVATWELSPETFPATVSGLPAADGVV
jgi:hypothetical protein